MITSREIEQNMLFIEKLIKYVKARRKSINEEGSLRVCHKKTRTDFYRVTQKGDTKGTYIPKADIEKAKALAQKDYYDKILPVLEHYLKAFGSLNNTSLNEALSDVYESLHPQRRDLITPVYLPDKDYAEKWSAENVTQKGFSADDTSSFYTDRNERVRSKSEVMIANRFHALNIPYVYEPALDLDGQTIHPDFRILNLRTRKSYYFENFGMMDDQKYSSKAIARINTYILNGYALGEGLLFTMETSSKPLDMRILNALIDEFLT